MALVLVSNNDFGAEPETAGFSTPIGDFDTNTLAAIEPLRAAGFALHHLHPRSKRPIGKEWSNAPVASLAELRATHATGNNLGVRLGEPSALDAGYLHVLDFDIRIPDLADEAWEAFERLFPDVRVADLPCVASGSGGESRHLYFVTSKPFDSKKLAVSESKHRRWDAALKRDVWSYDWEIELFGTGKQVVLPPSIHPDTGLPYRWERPFDFDAMEFGLVPEIPAAVVEGIGAARTTEYAFESREPLSFKDGQLENELNLIPVSRIDDREDWVTLGMALHHQFGGSDEGFRLWMQHSARGSKYLVGSSERAELRRYRHFGRNRKRPVTMASVRQWVIQARHAALIAELDDLDEPHGDGSEFDDLIGAPHPAANDDDWDGGPEEPVSADPVTARLNKLHAVVAVRGRTLITTERPNGSVDFGTVRDLHTLYENVRVPTQDGKMEAASRRWLRHRDRRTYSNGVTFSPGKHNNGVLNLWRGWAVEPDASASCALFLDHVRNVVCRGNPAHAEYLIGWLAHMVQRPDEKPGVALVLRGGKGAGKDTVADYVSKMIGRRHAPTVAETDHIVGKFNARLENALLLHVQEGSWAGDRKAEGVLKYLVTSDHIEIERKGIDSINLPSVLRIFISANAEWVVPASRDERRWAVFEVSDARRGDDPYFAALRAEMKGRGPAALLHHLRTYDLSGFNVRAVPETDGLRNQKIASLRNVDLWWFETLCRGEIPDYLDTGSQWDAAVQAVGRDQIRSAYLSWIKGRRYDGEALEERHFGRRLRELVPAIGESRTRASPSGQRVRKYILPVLADCRAAFDEWLGSAVDWDSLA